MSPIPSDQIRERAQQRRDEAAGLLSKLVSIRSYSGREDEVVAWIKTEMERRGFHDVKVDPFGNVHGRVGSGKRLIAYDAHVDTVETGEASNWTVDPYGGEIKDGKVWGRGACDQKGGMAAMLVAGSIAQETGLPDDVTLQFTGSVQEEDCDGLCWQYILREENLNPEAVVITEPTNLGVYRGQRGRLEIDIRLKGVSCHGSAPERGLNAATLASRVALDVDGLHGRLPNHPFLGKGSITVTELKTESPSLCAVPDRASLHLDRRLTLGETPESAVAEVKHLDAIKAIEADVSIPVYDRPTHTGLVYPTPASFPAWVFEEDHPLIAGALETARAIMGGAARQGCWTFSTNGVSTAGMFGVPTVGFGPGDETHAHAPDEHTPVSHLVTCAAFYALLPWHLHRPGRD